MLLQPGPGDEPLVEEDAGLDAGELVLDAVDERLDLKEGTRVEGQEVDGREEVGDILTFEVNGRDVSVKEVGDPLREELEVVAGPESVEAAGEKMKHLVPAPKHRQQHVVVDVLRVVDILGGGAVRLLAADAGNRG